MRLLAISDLHLNYEANRRALSVLPSHRDDWLALAGDVGSREEDLEFALDVLLPRFERVAWVPGNHDLWSVDGEDSGARGEARYERLVSICRSRGVLTPEDPYEVWPGDGPPCLLAPLFLLYDYSFRPDEVPEERAVDWAAESGVLCADERYLYPDPWPSRQAWCRERTRRTAERLAALPAYRRAVLVNHFPLRRDLTRIPRIPRFTVWCGTRETEDWHIRFRAAAVVSGHLHVRATDWRDGVRFEEVSLGYPHQWHEERGLEGYLREILPGPASGPSSGNGGPVWRR
ncbi:MAG: metallophosphoesterase [Planctomycetes bacterium]|nr:metallophosphoesterase [Planctomycetota bacterium]